VSLGERLMKDVYEALRNGPAWNDTLFIITYVIFSMPKYQPTD
jgi:phospholipase C